MPAVSGRGSLLAPTLPEPDGGPGGLTTISLGHVLSFLRTRLRDHWDLVQHAQMLDPALGFLSLIEKAERGTESP
jgi:hypothetical protein